MQEFLNIVNQKMKEFNIQFIYNPADGVDCVTNMKYVEFKYNSDINSFIYKIKNIDIDSQEESIILMNEITISSKIIAVLKDLECIRLELALKNKSR